MYNDEDLSSMNIGQEQLNLNVEFLFVKVANCTKTEKAVILGNVYLSPFVDLCELKYYTE